MLNSIISEKIIRILGDAIDGKQDNAIMRIRQLINTVKTDSPDFASDLSALLQKKTATKKNLRYVPVENGPPKAEPVDSDTRQKLIKKEYTVILEYEPIWSDEVYSSFSRFINERKQSDILKKNGLNPSRSLLMSGPPGVGKTMSASWLAQELDLPLVTLDLATVMSSYLGKTGNNIRSVLNYAQSFPCVLLLDEFDSIAKKRDDDSDVGELKRLVTVLLQAIDDWPDSSVLVAATNHGELLDQAIWRRFDKVIDVGFPDKELIKKFLGVFDIHSQISEFISPNFEGMSYAEITRVLVQAKSNSILE